MTLGRNPKTAGEISIGVETANKDQTHIVGDLGGARVLIIERVTTRIGSQPMLT